VSGARFAGRPLSRRPAADQIADSIRLSILRGELEAGSPLRESEIAAAFGVARNTVREALRLLGQHGLTSHEVHRGVAVRRFSAEEVREVFDVRAIVEAAAARRVGTLSREEVARLESVLEASEAAARRDDYVEVLTQNLEFHRAMVGLLQNSRLDRTFGQLAAEVTLMLVSLDRDVAGPWLDRNRTLLELLQGSDEAAFTRELRRYLDVSRDDVLSRVTPPPGERG
jgi:DNA-binding GntR family transcriptional regulator